MPITEFTQPSEYQPIDTYTPIPFQELLQAGLAKQSRVEEGLAAQEALETELGTFDALEYVQGPQGSRIKVGDKDRVQSRVDQYLNQIDELTRTYKDPSSMEFRAGIRGILRNLRQDKSPTGVIGQAAANKASYGQILKNLQEAEQLGTRPHLAADIYRDLGNFASLSMESPASLASASTVGEGIDAQETLAGLMKNLTASYLGDEFAASGRVPGFTERKTLEGITYEDAYNTAKNLIATNPDLIRDLQLRQQYAQQTNQVFDARQTADDLARTMAGLFKQGKVKFDTQTDPFALAQYKKSLEEKDTDTLMSNNVVIGLPSTIYDTPDKLMKNTAELKTQANQIVEEKSKFIDLNGIDLKTGIAEDGTDKSRELHEYDKAYELAFNKYNNLVNLDRRVREEVGITDDYTPSQMVIDKAKREAKKLYDSQAKIAYSLATSPEDYVGKTEQQFVEDNYSEFLKDVDPKYKEYREKFKELSKASSAIVGITEVPKKLAERDVIKEGLRLFTPNFEAATKNVANASTGEALNESEFEKHDFTHGKLQGFYFDPADRGKLKLAYSVPTKEKEGTGAQAAPKGFMTIKTAAPAGFDMELVKQGYVDQLDIVVNNQLYNELSEYTGRKPVVLGQGETQMSFTADKDPFTKKWTISVPTASGKIDYPASSDAEAINIIKAAYIGNVTALAASQQK